MLSAILIVFLVTELPQATVSLLAGLYPGDMLTHLYRTVGNVLDLLSLINSSVNFVRIDAGRVEQSLDVSPIRLRCFNAMLIRAPHSPCTLLRDELAISTDLPTRARYCALLQVKPALRQFRQFFGVKVLFNRKDGALIGTSPVVPHKCLNKRFNDGCPSAALQRSRTTWTWARQCSSRCRWQWR